MLKKIMEKALKAIFAEYEPYKAAINRLIRNKNSYLYTSGWMESRKRGYPCNTDGQEIPWMNFPIIDFLEERLSPQMTLFEYGSGYSTLFYARHVYSVTSVEYDESWYNLIRERIPENAELIYQAKDIDGDYCRTICNTNEMYDIVVIDGRDRVNCIKQSINKLRGEGVILLDDSSRERYQKGIDFMKQNNFRTLTFRGLKPIGNGAEHQTTIFYRDNNCLGL
jgi:precorrin-6B methylase 2